MRGGGIVAPTPGVNSSGSGVASGSPGANWRHPVPGTQAKTQYPEITIVIKGYYIQAASVFTISFSYSSSLNQTPASRVLALLHNWDNLCPADKF